MFRKSIVLVALSFMLISLACKSTVNKNPNDQSLEENLNEKNRISVSLLNRIRRLPGISLRNGVPIFGKANNSVESISEPLYILDDYIVGNSFRSVNGLIRSINVKKVEALSASDASIYGSRASNGVIKITSYD